MSAVTPIDYEVSKRLRARRCELGLTQSHCARALGISFQQFQKYESGANRISSGRLYDLANLLDVDIGYFFSGIGTKVLPSAKVSKATVALVREIASLDPREQRLAHRLVRAIRDHD